MIRLTKLDGSEFLLNEAMIETVFQNPDTIITLSNGKIYVVMEKLQDIVNLINSANGKFYK